MPPPKTIPSLSGRPHSMYKYENSPPVHSSPLSPPYSTESDGSSISIDEPDFPHPLMHDHAIPEENDILPGGFEDYANTSSLAPYPPSSIRKGSPAANPDAYMEMCPFSSCSSSPVEQTGNGYMPMSPSGEYRRG